MEIQRRRRGRTSYLYLAQSFRDRGRVRKLERYLGPTIPRDVSREREALLLDVFSRTYGQRLAVVARQFGEALRRTPPEIRAKNLDWFATQFTYDSNRIEGSTLSLRDTAELLGRGITPPNRPIADVYEALAHRSVFLSAIGEEGALSRGKILAWHRQLFAGTKPSLAGKVRTFPVRISGSQFVPPQSPELDPLMRDFFSWHKDAVRTIHPVARAALVHLRLVSIHPFGDGNGRVTRIAMNRELRLAKLPMFNIPFTRRKSYYSALERSRARTNETPFLRWFVRHYLAQTGLGIAT